VVGRGARPERGLEGAERAGGASAGHMGRSRSTNPQARGAGPTNLRESLPKAAALAGMPGAVELASLGKHWVTVVGPDVAAHSRPAKLEDGVLTVVVKHHAWAAQLRLLSGQVLGRARALSPSLRSVRVQLDDGRGLVSW
jgi:predicted nucleic acid-binding Zn ribbon protein